MRTRRRGTLLAAAVLSVVSTLGCSSVGPEYEPPELQMPDAWERSAVEGLGTGEANLHTWWRHLDDPMLDALIERAAARNLDVVAALQRVIEARALRGVAAGERYPDIDATGGVSRGRLSEGTSSVVPPPRSRSDGITELGAEASWELDVWGRVSRSIESADADVAASVEDYRDTLVVLYAEVASTYVEYRTLQARVAYNESNVASQAETVKLTRDRYETEISPELDVRQAELNLASTESALPALRSQREAAVHRLGVLLGEPPRALAAELGPVRPIPLPPEPIALGVPADLLRQRPDVRAAERRLASQTARVGVATADLYPRFTLNGFFEYRSVNSSSGNLVDSGNREWSFGPSMRWNLFDGGRVRGTIDFETARAEELLAVYEQTVLRALEETENAMVAYAEERDRRDALDRSVQAAKRSVELVEDLYKLGLTDFQNVLDSERSLFQQQDAFAASEGAVVRNLIAVYRALGGGWEPEVTAEVTAKAEAATPET